MDTTVIWEQLGQIFENRNAQIRTVQVLQQ